MLASLREDPGSFLPGRSLAGIPVHNSQVEIQRLLLTPHPGVKPRKKQSAGNKLRMLLNQRLENICGGPPFTVRRQIQRLGITFKGFCQLAGFLSFLSSEVLLPQLFVQLRQRGVIERVLRV